MSATISKSGSPLRGWVWVLHMAIPLAGLWLVLARPEFDLRWEHHLSHFWLVVGVAAVTLALGLDVSRAAHRRQDARLSLVALAFVVSASFLLLHGLATPQVILPSANAGFTLASPVGLVLASVLAALSAVEWSPARADWILALHRPLLVGVVGLAVLWALTSLLRVGALDTPMDPERGSAALTTLAVVGTPLFALAALRYLQIHRRRPAVMLVSIATAFVLLAEALVTVALARNWQASWWLWHVLMTLGFLFVAYSARVQTRREGSGAGIFDAVALRQTVRQLEEEYQDALDTLVAELRRQPELERDAPLTAARLTDRFHLTEAQGRVLAEAGGALADERTQSERLQALVALGQQTRVITDERTLLDSALEAAARGFPRDQLDIRLSTDGADASALEETAWREPVTVSRNGTRALLVPLTVKGNPVGLLEVVRPAGDFHDRDRWALQSLGSQLSVALENARLYAQLQGLFRQYMSPDVATTLLADPSQAGLGGQEREVTVLFADLRGFTPFSERSAPDAVVKMLNRYFGTAVPAVLDEGGTVVQFVGDALMAVFNAPTRQTDHALRGARAALRLQEAADQIVAEQPDWPRFRVGINTGPALVGNIGGEQVRNYTAIGDTTNLAARLQTYAAEGQVVIGATTRTQLGDLAHVIALGPLDLKGKAAPVHAFVLEALGDHPVPTAAPLTTEDER